MLWGAISYQGLFPNESSVFIDEWLERTRQEDDDNRKEIYFTDDKYAKFIQTILAQKAAEELDDLQNVVFQDDQDRK